MNEVTAKEIIGERTGVTGVTEEIDPVGTVKAAFGINPGIEKIYVVYDSTADGIRHGEYAIGAITGYAPGTEVTGLSSDDPEAVFETVSRADDNSIVVCTAFTAGNAADMQEIDHFCRALGSDSRVPVYHLFDIGFGNGAAGGSMVSAGWARKLQMWR